MSELPRGSNWEPGFSNPEFTGKVVGLCSGRSDLYARWLQSTSDRNVQAPKEGDDWEPGFSNPELARKVVGLCSGRSDLHARWLQSTSDRNVRAPKGVRQGARVCEPGV